MRILADEGLACGLNLGFYSAWDILWTLKALGRSKISRFGSFELKFEQKLSENCWRQHFFCLKIDNFQEKVISVYKNSSTKHFKSGLSFNAHF